MFSIGTVMTLKPGGYPGYKKAHDDIWPELAQLINNAGISMSIYHHEDLLFIHAIAPSEEKWDSIGGEVTEKWYKWMTEFLETDPNGKTIVIHLTEAFSFGEFSQ